VGIAGGTSDWRDPSRFYWWGHRERLALQLVGMGSPTNWRETLPFGTLAVNLTGSLLIGFALNYARPELHRALSQTVLAFVVVGICGGLTTFSSFILQTFHLLRQRRFWIALANVLLSTILCIGMVAVGWWLATLVLG
jgi:fluoride exporter